MMIREGAAIGEFIDRMSPSRRDTRRSATSHPLLRKARAASDDTTLEHRFRSRLRLLHQSWSGAGTLRRRRAGGAQYFDFTPKVRARLLG